MNDTPQTNTAAQPRVSRLTVGRLHNLGNYEHVRYEVTVDLPAGASPALVLSQLEQLLDDLEPKSPVSAHELEMAQRALAQPAGELGAYDRSHLDLYQERISEDNAHQAKRAEARRGLERLGMVGVHTDAKDKWEDPY